MLDLTVHVPCTEGPSVWSPVQCNVSIKKAFRHETSVSAIYFARKQESLQNEVEMRTSTFTLIALMEELV
jgi:hypothetical protein